jgi:phenylacetate-CoA ligase
MGRRYWNDAIETLSPAGLNLLETSRLRSQLAYVYRSSAFYREKFEQAGIGPDDVRDRTDLPKIPFTEKSELARSQGDGTLIGVNQCARLEDIVRIQATGGTTGQPLRIAYTRNDNAGYCESGARALWAMGCRPGDIVFECFNYNLYAGGISDHMCFETLGAATIPFGVGNSRRLLGMMGQIKDDVCLYSTPSYAVRLAETALQDGLDLRSLGLRKGFFAGEAGLQIPGYRQRIEDLWGLQAVDLYGTGELGMHCGECEYRSGFHYGAAGIVLTELIDPDSGEPRPFTDGAIGEFVYTSIQREASPLLRMRSHDSMQVFTEPCPCGRTGWRFKVLGRTDDMFIVKGVNVFPLGVQAVLSKLQPAITGEFQIILDKPPPIDYAVRLRVELASHVALEQREALMADVRRAIREGSNFDVLVEWVPQGEIASEKKTRRLYRTYRGDTL